MQLLWNTKISFLKSGKTRGTGSSETNDEFQMSLTTIGVA
jgi:hypothetical protein